MKTICEIYKITSLVINHILRKTSVLHLLTNEDVVNDAAKTTA